MLRQSAWSVHYSSRDLPQPEPQPWHLQISADEWELWLDDLGIPDGTPYLLSPCFVYDTDLNSYFHQVNLMEGPLNSQLNRASALCRKLSFLHQSRGGKDWRDANEADHTAYYYWRRRDLRGPRVDGDTWSQEVSHLQQFYVYAKKKLWVPEVPIPQRPPQDAYQDQKRGGQQRWKPGDVERTVPATYAHDVGGQVMEWLPAPSYRSWRDVGVLGYDREGLPRDNFRGRWASRNGTFTDSTVRTGLRLEEQASRLITEVPTGPGPAGYSKSWLPAAIAKRNSARWVYEPASVRRDLTAYADEDRRWVIEEARDAGRYSKIRRPIVIFDPQRPHMAQYTSGINRGEKIDVRLLGPRERQRLLIDTEQGLEPAMFWLGEGGMPLSLSTWKDMFTDANRRCQEQGLDLQAHAHLLRHTFAVITLEQLQRGHIAALGDMNADQRLHYQRIFGDPLDWVRRRLGHASILSTLIYLHALQELEMETRMALVPDTWENPRHMPDGILGDEQPPSDLPSEVTA
ncbi:integrase [Streptomyces sp. MBT55]|uniref:integrase n=1 Tax=Streptomyces sp. MBT55 TaxID=1488386 RepID=UPI0019116214|nr:integrase [Streptomyces sp. MBT55]MBK6042237.1 integrase [Streptomyces sp. MBT55]